MIQITDEISLNSIDEAISKEVCLLEYWGDLDLSFDDLEVLNTKLKRSLERGCGIDVLCKNYPHVITSYMVFFVRYKYDVNFWGALGEDLGVELNQYNHTALGECARRMFKRYKMDFSEANDEARVNIAPIVYEACLPPESSLSDLFYVLSYDTYNSFDPQLIIEELIEMRSYTIRKPMMRFLKRFKDERAVDFILEVRDAMVSSNQRTTSTSRYSNSYTEWKAQEKSKESIRTRKNQEFQTKPYLFFDNGKKGLCVVLPRVILASEWVIETTWKIKGKSGFEKTIHCNVMGDEGIRYTESMNIAVSPDELYTVSIEDSEQLDDSAKKVWEIDGVTSSKILAFNSAGRNITANAIPSPFGFFIFREDLRIADKKNVDIEDQFYPTDVSGYRITTVVPNSNSSSIVFSSTEKEITLAARPQINLELNGKTLFATESNVFTEIPELKVFVDGMLFDGGLELRVGNISVPVNLSEEGTAVFNLKKIAKEEMSHYGTHSVRLYRMGRFVKQVEFCYIPKVKSNYSSVVNWPLIDERKEKKSYKFQKLDDWEMEFTNCVVSSDENNYIVQAPTNVGEISFTLKSMLDDFVFSCSIDLPINPFEVELVNRDGSVIENVTDKFQKTGLEDFVSEENWISFKGFGDFHNYRIALVTSNGKEQEEFIKLTQSNASNINLSVFYDTLNNCPLPAKLVLVCDEHEEEIPLICITEELTMEVQPRMRIGENVDYVMLSIDDDGKDIDVVRFGFNMNKYHLTYADSKLTKNGLSRGYKYPERLSEGIYIVTGNKENAAFEFENEEVELSAGNNVALVSCGREVEGRIANSKEWLDLLIKDVISNTVANKEVQSGNSWKAMNDSRFSKLIKFCDFDDADIEKLVALAYFASSKISNVNKHTIRECMRFISINLLRRGDRYRIMTLLMKLNCPQEVFDICLSDYSLMLFFDKESDKRSLASQIENYSLELSMMLMMSEDLSIRDCIWREKYRDLIGKDAIRKLLSVPGEDDPSVVAEEQKKFLRETAGSKIYIDLDDSIAGNQEAIQGMIEFRNFQPYFNLSKKPDFGIYFARIKYVDQYVNWYKNSHTPQFEMKPDIREKMNTVTKQHYEEIVGAFNILKKDSELGNMAKHYSQVLSLRWDGYLSSSVPMTISYPLFFRIEGLAAFLAKLPSERTDLDKLRTVGIQFMSIASIVAPRLSQRDVLMAATYIYLKRKEEKLCR